MPLYYAQQYITKTLNGAIDASQTSGITLSNTTGLDIAVPGIVAISWSDPLNTTVAEWISYTSINGSGVLQGVTRGAEGSTAKSHSNGAVIAFPLSKAHINELNDGLKDVLSVTPNYKIVPSVASDNLTVALKTLAGNDPSTSDPIYIRIGDEIKTITSALSSTLNAGSNYFNSGSTELATKEVDYFVYVGYSVTSSAMFIGFARIPYANLLSDFVDSTTSEKLFSEFIGSLQSTSASKVTVIGRFGATLSAGAGYTWTVPTFNATNLIQRPIYETRALIYTPALGQFTLGNGAILGEYQITNNVIFFKCGFKFGSTSSLGAGQFSFGSVPFKMYEGSSTDSSLSRVVFSAQFHDTGATLYSLGAHLQTGAYNIQQWQTSGGIASNTSPIATWATGDGAFISGSYLI